MIVVKKNIQEVIEFTDISVVEVYEYVVMKNTMHLLQIVLGEVVLVKNICCIFFK